MDKNRDQEPKEKRTVGYELPPFLQDGGQAMIFGAKRPQSSSENSKEMPQSEFPVERNLEERAIIDDLERGRSRKMTEQEKNFALKQAREIGDL